jgi:hypothetical protein
MKARHLFLSLMGIAALLGAQPITTSLARTKDDKEVKFTVRIENISGKDGQTASNGEKWPFALSPGFYALHEREVRFLNEGRPAGPNGLEMQAEDGNPSGMVAYLMGHHSQMLHGVFNTPKGGETPGPIGPGGVYEFSFTAKPGMKLSLVTMFGQSNDWFYAPEPGGIHLFNNGKPTSGDITAKFILWDAGTEVNEEPGIGPNQAPRQKAPNTGADERGKVHKAKESTFFSKTGELFRITINSEPMA